MTPDSPKGPESDAATFASLYRSEQSRANELETRLAETEDVYSELLRGMAARASDFRRALAFADAHVPQWERIIDEHKAEVSRLREQLAAATATLSELVTLKDGPRDVSYHERKPLAWQTARVFLAGAPFSESVPATPQQDEDAVLFAVAQDRVRRDKGVRHTLEDVAAELELMDEGRPSGSERLAPRSVKTFDCKQDCEAVAPECFCVGTEPHRLCCHEDAAQAARSEATPEEPSAHARVWTRENAEEPKPAVGDNFPNVVDAHGVRWVADERDDGFEGWRSDSHGFRIWRSWAQLLWQRGPLTASRLPLSVRKEKTVTEQIPHVLTITTDPENDEEYDYEITCPYSPDGFDREGCPCSTEGPCACKLTPEQLKALYESPSGEAPCPTSPTGMHHPIPEGLHGHALNACWANESTDACDRVDEIRREHGDGPHRVRIVSSWDTVEFEVLPAVSSQEETKEGETDD